MSDLHPAIVAAQLAAIREICANDGHRWKKITVFGSPWGRSTCQRGCGAGKVELIDWVTRSADQVVQMLAELGPTAEVQDITVVIEPAEEADHV